MTREYKKLGEKTIKIKDGISGYDKDILVKTFRLPNGVIENFFIDKANDSVQIFPITSEGEVIVVKQFRAGDESQNLELPGGGIEKGEDPADAAERELKEETGFSGEMSYLGKQPYGPYSTGVRHMFAANNCKRVDGLELDDNEFLTVISFPLYKFRTLLRQGKFRGVECSFLGLDHLDLL